MIIAFYLRILAQIGADKSKLQYFNINKYLAFRDLGKNKPASGRQSWDNGRLINPCKATTMKRARARRRAARLSGRK